MTDLIDERESQPYKGYDRAVVDFLHQRMSYPPTENARKLLCVFATPERAFGEVWERLNAGKKYDPKDQKTVPLPYASIDRTAVDFDPNRDRQVATFRRMGSLWDHKKGEEVFYEMPWPIPVTISYQITFWVRQIRDGDDLVMQLHLLLDMPGRGIYLDVEHPFPMDKKLVWTHLGEVRRLPVIEAPGRQRQLRTAVELIMDGWIARPARFYTRVEEIRIETSESADMVTPGQLLDVTVITTP